MNNGGGRIVVEPDDLSGRIVLKGAAAQLLLQSAAFMVAGVRRPVPSGGAVVGNATGVNILVEGASLGAVIDVIPLADGYALKSGPQTGPVSVNGSRLHSGETKLLSDGDVVAFGGELLHFRAPGSARHSFARVTPIDVGRISADRDLVTFGRAPGNTIVLGHPTVALHHAEITRMRGSTELVARDGEVRVNGVQVHRAPLRDGDELAIGPYRILFAEDGLIERAAGGGLGVASTDATVTVGDATILAPTDLYVQPGEMVALIGESGAGKTTLMNVLAGVTMPSGGRVEVGGEPPGTRRAEIGYVPQFDLLHGGLTLVEAVDYAARLRLPQDTTRAERAARISEVLTQLGLAERANVRIDSLSGGQRKRASVGVELLARPGIVFLDEPTTGLDPGLERQLMLLLRSLADGGQTIVLVTHATSSLQMCDRVVLMAPGGRLRFEGAPDALLRSFDINDFDEVYGASLDRPRTSGRRLDLASAFQVGSDRVATAPVPRRARFDQSFAHQTRVLTSRFLKLMARDRRHLATAILQVPVLALIATLLFPSDVFAVDPAPWPGKSAQLLFVLVIIAGWLGSIGAAREIVKERNVTAREFAAGLRVGSYIASKISVLLGFVGLQAFIFCLIVFALRPLHADATDGAKVFAIVVVTAGLSVLPGLLVSATARSEDQATGVIPLLLVPAMLLSGAIVTIADMSSSMQVLAGLIPTRWSFAAAGEAIDLNARIASDPHFASTNQFGTHFFIVGFGGFLFITAAFASVFLTALALRLRRTARGR